MRVATTINKHVSVVIGGGSQLESSVSIRHSQSKVSEHGDNEAMLEIFGPHEK